MSCKMIISILFSFIIILYVLFSVFLPKHVIHFPRPSHLSTEAVYLGGEDGGIWIEMTKISYNKWYGKFYNHHGVLWIKGEYQSLNSKQNYPDPIESYISDTIEGSQIVLENGEYLVPVGIHTYYYSNGTEKQFDFGNREK